MKSLIFLGILLAFLPAHGEECFEAKPTREVTEESCGSVEASITLKDCLSGEVHKSFNATMGFDCSENPPKLKLLYNNNKMLVVEYSLFNQKSTLGLTKSYILDQSRVPNEASVKTTRGQSCFTMKPKEKIDPNTCDPVKTEIQFKDCKTNSPVGTKLEVTAHYTCGEHQTLKYWYRKMMLVGVVKKSGQNLKVTDTFSIVYPSQYGVYNDRTTSSVQNTIKK